MTRNLIISVLVSLDGYIADSDGSVLKLEQLYHDHLPAGLGDWRVPKGFDTILTGKNAYQAYYSSLAQLKNKQLIILTHDKIFKHSANAHLYAGDIVTLIKKLKQQKGKDIWLFGGSQVINQLTSKNLVDQIRLVTLPLNLGSGIKLFDPKLPAPQVSLENMEVKHEVTYSIWKKL